MLDGVGRTNLLGLNGLLWCGFGAFSSPRPSRRRLRRLRHGKATPQRSTVDGRADEDQDERASQRDRQTKRTQNGTNKRKHKRTKNERRRRRNEPNQFASICLGSASLPSRTRTPSPVSRLPSLPPFPFPFPFAPRLRLRCQCRCRLRLPRMTFEPYLIRPTNS